MASIYVNAGLRCDSDGLSPFFADGEVIDIAEIVTIPLGIILYYKDMHVKFELSGN